MKKTNSNSTLGTKTTTIVVAVSIVLWTVVSKLIGVSLIATLIACAVVVTGYAVKAIIAHKKATKNTAKIVNADAVNTNVIGARFNRNR